MNPDRSSLNSERAGAIPDLLLHAFDARAALVMAVALGGAAVAITQLVEPPMALLALLAVAAAGLSWLAALSLALLAVVLLLAWGVPVSSLDVALLVVVPVLVAVHARRAAVSQSDASDGDEQNTAQTLEALYRTIVHTAFDGMLMLDADGRVLEANAAFCRMLGVERDALLRMDVGDWQAETTRERVCAMIRDGMVSREPQRFETMHRRADGSTYRAQISAQVVSVGDRRLAIASVRDITDAKAASVAREGANALRDVRAAALTDDVVAARHGAERAARANAHFLANVSHHLRTPIHAVLTFAGIGLQRTAGNNPDDAACFRRIRLSAEQLSGFVDDLILLTRLQSGTRRVSPARVDLQAQVGGAQSALAISLSSKAVHLVTDIAPGLSASLDPVLMRRLLIVLLAYACRRSPEGGAIRLKIREQNVAANAGGVRRGIALTLSDAGPVVDEAALERLFDAFFERAAPAGSDETGLALALAAQIARVHGGTIAVQTGSEHVGLVFSLWLPRDGRDNADER